MKKINFVLAVAFLLSLSLVYAELYQSQQIIIDKNTSTVYYQGYYYVDDTNSNNISTGTPTNVLLYYTVTPLPYYNATHCNITIQKVTYSIIPNLTAYSTVYRNYGTSGSPVGSEDRYSLYGRDQLKIESACHYNDITPYYTNNRYPVMIGLLSSSYSCNECLEYDYQTVVNSSLNYDAYANYDKFDIILRYDYQFWLILEWVVKIMFIFVGIGVLFLGAYYLYKFVKNIEESIR